MDCHSEHDLADCALSILPSVETLPWPVACQRHASLAGMASLLGHRTAHPMGSHKQVWYVLMNKLLLLEENKESYQLFDFRTGNPRHTYNAACGR